MLRERLKTETRAYHERLERALAIVETVKTLEGYRALLVHFYGFYQTIEAKLLVFAPEFEAQGFDLPSRRKAPRIEGDLRALGYRGEDISKLPVCTDLPAMRGFMRALGCAYVLEGATLGGQILARHFQETLRLAPETGLAFFSGYGSQISLKWEEMLRLLTAQEPRLSDFDEVLGAACDTFGCLERWMAARHRPDMHVHRQGPI